MGFFDFIKDVGEKIGLGGGPEITSEALVSEVQKNKLEIDGLDVSVTDGKVTVDGKVKSQDIKEKIILCLGNVKGVSQVNDNIIVELPQPESIFHTVVKGDTLGKISKKYYGNAMKYPVIFEANKPMLKDPDKIYPGQVLRIPDLKQ